jgi:hypothetical protein
MWRRLPRRLKVFGILTVVGLVFTLLALFMAPMIREDEDDIRPTANCADPSIVIFLDGSEDEGNENNCEDIAQRNVIGALVLGPATLVLAGLTLWEVKKWRRAEQDRTLYPTS